MTDWLAREANEVGLDLHTFMQADRSFVSGDQFPGYLYVIVCGDYLKIGVTRDVDRRLNDMGLANPFPMHVAHTEETPSMSCAMLAERTAHRLLGDAAVGREWFIVPERRAIKTARVTAEAARLYFAARERAAREYAARERAAA
jgi:hypothetical protein